VLELIVLSASVLVGVTVSARFGGGKDIVDGGWWTVVGCNETMQIVVDAASIRADASGFGHVSNPVVWRIHFRPESFASLRPPFD
jgi:hypothetical protein